MLSSKSAPAYGPPRAQEDWRQRDEWLAAWDAPLNVVVGEQRRQRELRKLANCSGRCLRLVDVTLQPEPDNPVDSAAVATWVNGTQVGYLRAELAAALADGCADRGMSVPTYVVAGIMRGGWSEERSIGVHVWLDQTVTPGPVVRLEDAEDYEVQWPPREEELAVLAR